MKTTIDLPDDLLIEAKKRAAELRQALRALIADDFALSSRSQRSGAKRRSFGW
jgi:hypothetical protein